MIDPKRVIVITGASSGIGLATANLFASKGYVTYGLSRRMTNTKDFIEIQADVNDESSMQSAIAHIAAEQGRIDILFNNAGIVMVGAAEESSTAQVKSLFETNFFGAVRATNLVLPYMRKQGSGRIIHTGSLVGFIPSPFMSYYCASKHALEGYSESLDHEIRGFGIRSIVLEPGFMRTAINANPVLLDCAMEVYAEGREKVATLVERSLASSPAPEMVALKVLEAAESSRPMIRYPIGWDAVLISPFRRYAPRRLFDRILRYRMKLAGS